MKNTVFILLMASAFVFSSCDKEEPTSTSTSTSSSTNQTSKNKVKKPSIVVSTAVTTTTDFDVVFKVTCEEEASVTLHYGTTSSCNKSSSCRLYQDGEKIRYYKSSHTGFSEGTKIYFYGEATNSGGTDKTSVDYRITKR